MRAALRQRTSATTVIYFLTHALLITLGVILSLLKGAFWVAIGTSLIATGAAGIVIFVYVTRTESSREAMELIRQFGLERIYDRRAAQIRSEYASRLASASSAIDILGFGLKDFRRDYVAELGAMSARAKVRILLMDPDADLPQRRDIEEGQSTGTIASEIKEFLTQFSQHYGTAATPTLELRLFTCLPSVNVFRIDNELFWGPYFIGRASGNTFTLRARRGFPMYEQLLSHFEEIWLHHSRSPTGWS